MYGNTRLCVFIIFSDEYDSSTSVLIRTCEDDIAVNKCEGACASSIKPSVVSNLGFQKVSVRIRLRGRFPDLKGFFFINRPQESFIFKAAFFN